MLIGLEMWCLHLLANWLDGKANTVSAQNGWTFDALKRHFDINVANVEKLTTEIGHQSNTLPFILQFYQLKHISKA